MASIYSSPSSHSSNTIPQKVDFVNYFNIKLSTGKTLPYFSATNCGNKTNFGKEPIDENKLNFCLAYLFGHLFA